MMENGFAFIVEDRQYTIMDQLGRGANTIAYLAECRHDGLNTKCILKEFAPDNKDDFEAGKERFLASGKMQNRIRQLSALNNATPPVSHVFEMNGTVFIDVACYHGTTLDHVGDLSLQEVVELCKAITKTVGYYHRFGFLCLDLKPENIFILQNTPEDRITQLVEFIDFDSIRDVKQDGKALFSYTREWAAPEQRNPYHSGKIRTAADIYTVGEIIFYLVFGRHSTDAEHRSFSTYPFKECKREYRNLVDRMDVQALLARIFRNTLRPAPVNRFKNVDDISKLLDELVEVLKQKEYVIPKLPLVSPGFIGRENEIKRIKDCLSQNPVLCITGIGGIGKSTLVKNYIARHKADYDVIAYLEYDGDFKHTFCDDMQLQISTVSKEEKEGLEDYFSRKRKVFQRICGDKRVLFVVDNYNDRICKDLSRIMDCGYDTLIVTRNQPPKNSFPYMEILALEDSSALLHLVSINLDRVPDEKERECFAEIIEIVQGHTLVIELIARQIAAGSLDIQVALDLIRERGFSRFSGERVGEYKDGEEVYDTLSAIISGLFDASDVSVEARLVLKILALLDVRGIEGNLWNAFFPKIDVDLISNLSRKGWLYEDGRIRLHPVIAETVRGWLWPVDDVTVMDYHGKIIDFYVGMANDAQIKKILREAERFKDQHTRHLIQAMYHDMLGWYYDVLLDGAYEVENEEEADLLQKLIHASRQSIYELQLSSDPRKIQYLIKSYLSLASVLIRCLPEHHDEAAEMLDMAFYLIEENEPEFSEQCCYYYMVAARYYTFAKPDLCKTRSLVKKAEEIARKVFSTDLERIDIIHIPTANCFFYLDDLRAAARKIEEAIHICQEYPDMIPYIDKMAELMNILLEIYMEMDGGKIKARSRDLINQIDQINERYKEEGICQKVSMDIRNQML